MSSRTSPQTGVAIPQGFRQLSGIAPQAFPSVPRHIVPRNDNLNLMTLPLPAVDLLFLRLTGDDCIMKKKGGMTMVQPMIPCVAGNGDKQRTYRENIRRFNTAMQQEFYFEALLIDYAILEDRLSSLLYHIGALDGRTDRKICKKVKNQLRTLVGRYEKGEIKLTVTTISGKERILRAVSRWAQETAGACETDKYLAVLKEQFLAAEAFDSVLDDVDGWRSYRNEIIHGLMNKNVDALRDDLPRRCLQGMQLARALDSRIRMIKKGNRIRRNLKLKTP